MSRSEEKDSWDSLYSSAEDSFGAPKEKVEEVVEIFEDEGVSRVLDLGCGFGKHLFFLAERGFDAVGFDLSEEAVEEVEEKAERVSFDVGVFQGDMHEGLPFRDSRFDAVVSFRTLNHGRREDIQSTFEEVSRVLGEDGAFYFTVSKPSDFDDEDLPETEKVAPRTFVNLEGREEGVPHFLFDEDILVSMVEDAGLAVEELSADSEGYFNVFCRKS